MAIESLAGYLITRVKYRIDIRYSVRYASLMKVQRKITVMLPELLIKRALDASGAGLTPTLRKGLELVAAKTTYQKLLSLKGRFGLDIDLDVLRKDRRP